MDAISRNTASVAQDFHKAGGVHELNLTTANHQLLFNNKLPSQWTTREAAALLHSLSTAAAATQQQQHSNDYAFNHHQQQQQSERGYLYNGFGLTTKLRTRQHSTGEDDENTPSASSTTSSDGGDVGMTALPMKGRHIAANEQRRAMTAFLSKNFDLQESNYNNNTNASSNNNKRFHQQQQQAEDQENQVQLIRSPPAYNNFKTTTTTTATTLRTKQQQVSRNNQQQQTQQQHRPELFKEQPQQRPQQHDKENQQRALQQQQHAASFLTQLEYQNFNKIGTQFQNYVKDIINKYYAETPLLFPAMPTATTTPQQATKNESPTKKRRLMSETEEYIEYLKNKEDITLTITPKQQTGSNHKKATTTTTNKQQPTSNIALSITAAGGVHKQAASNAKLDFTPTAPLAATTTAFQAPQLQVNSANATTLARDSKPQRKSLTQLATLLPLLADAASQQQYLAAPLDFSKKSATTTPVVNVSTEPALPLATQAPIFLPTSSHALGNTTPTNDLVLNLSCSNSNSNSSFSSLATSIYDKRSSRKQAQPKKIRMPPEMVLTMLRDKYLNRLTGHKLSCAICTKQRPTHMLVFNYHSKGSLALHHYWQHRAQPQNCAHCDSTFKQSYSLKLHRRLKHVRQHGVKKIKKQHAKNLKTKAKNFIEKQVVAAKS